MDNVNTDLAVLETEFKNISDNFKKHEEADNERFGIIFKKLDKIEARLNMGIGALVILEVVLKLLH